MQKCDFIPFACGGIGSLLGLQVSQKLAEIWAGACMPPCGNEWKGNIRIMRMSAAVSPFPFIATGHENQQSGKCRKFQTKQKSRNFDNRSDKIIKFLEKSGNFIIVNWTAMK